MGALYLDASAAVKLIVHEAESDVLASTIRDHAVREQARYPLVASDLLRTELLAVAGRTGVGLEHARELLGGIYLVSVTTAICDSAGRLAGSADHPGLGSLDAIHLATALTVVGDLEAIVTYDHRFAESARGLGLAVHSPT